jgi:hypothetical protein
MLKRRVAEVAFRFKPSDDGITFAELETLCGCPCPWEDVDRLRLKILKPQPQ